MIYTCKFKLYFLHLYTVKHCLLYRYKIYRLKNVIKKYCVETDNGCKQNIIRKLKKKSLLNLYYEIYEYYLRVYYYMMGFKCLVLF